MTEQEYIKAYEDKYGPEGYNYALQDIRVSDNDPGRIEHLLYDLANLRDELRSKGRPLTAGYVSEAMTDLMSFQGILYRMRDWVKPEA